MPASIRFGRCIPDSPNPGRIAAMIVLRNRTLPKLLVAILLSLASVAAAPGVAASSPSAPPRR
jgi:hypothetical protein